MGAPWFALETTGSPGKAGPVAFCATLPVLASALAGGPVIDRLGRRRVSAASDLVCGLALAAIPLLHHAGALLFWMLYALMALTGLCHEPVRRRVARGPDGGRRRRRTARGARGGAGARRPAPLPRPLPGRSARGVRLPVPRPAAARHHRHGEGDQRPEPELEFGPAPGARPGEPGWPRHSGPASRGLRRLRLRGALLCGAVGERLPRRAVFTAGFLVGGAPPYVVAALTDTTAPLLATAATLLGIGTLSLLATLAPLAFPTWRKMDSRPAPTVPEGISRTEPSRPAPAPGP
ncbi:hypothetical protein [Streptomyces sp. SID5770]|uniref:hypothetical protein n=1 Tax=Streptomyces sp. SID5770 TaxID=2690308 RepID=UPI0031BBAE5C